MPVTPLPSDLQPARFIRHTVELRRLVDRLRSQSLLAVDTESNSLYAYYEKVCLVQLSTREQDYIIDPLAIDDMSPLGDLLVDPAIEIVFHAAEYDIITLKRDYGYTFSHIFDTMLAARACGWPAIGLGSILADQFGVRAEKRYQRANWATRPLPPEQLIYAQMDTHYLPELRDRLYEELKAAGRLEESYETFTQLAELSPAEHHFDPEGYWRINGVQDMRRSQMAVVRELYLARDEAAKRNDLPPFKVFTDGALLEIARLTPRRIEDLFGIKGLGGDQARRYGERIISAVLRGQQAKPPRPPQRREAADPQVHARYEALREWRKQRAAERGVESDVIVPRDTLWALAKRSPTCVEDLDDIPGLGPWRRAEYGEELIA
ncbi:MAG: ribonuclease D, partial [Chloroflexi bacterium]